jgi:putative FmdB family regulatory protein
MPVYEFRCRRCERPFVAIQHLADQGARLPECPRCRLRDRVERRVSLFTPVTPRKSVRG